MNNNIVKEIEIARELMRDLNNPRYRLLKPEEKALLLKSLNDYEDSLTTKVLEDNINAKLMKEDGIDVEEIKLPKNNTPSVKYEFASSLDLVPLEAKIAYLKDIMNTYNQENTFQNNLNDEEFRVMLKAIKEYTCNLQKTYHKAKKKQNRDEDIYENKIQGVKTN